jgi:hypothetical protein
MYELDCGCGCHLEGKDAQCLIIKFFLHLYGGLLYLRVGRLHM